MDPNSKCFVMLSHNIKSVNSNILKDDWYISEKYDGIRAIWDGKRMLTRAQREFNFVPQWFKDLLPSYPLEGELIVPGKPFSYFSGVTVRKEDDDRWKEIEYRLFDTPIKDKIFEERKKIVEDYVKSVNSKYITIADFKLYTNIDKNMQLIHNHFQDLIKEGKEGLMMIRKDNIYEAKRVKTILKYKKEYEGECIVIDYLEGTGKYKGILGKLRCKLTNGKEFNVGGGFIDEQRKRYIFDSDGKFIKLNNTEDNPVPEIGDTITYSCMEILEKTGIPRMPIFRGIRYDLS